VFAKEVDIEAAEEGGIEDAKEGRGEDDEAGEAEFGTAEQEEAEHGDQQDEGVVAGFDGEFALFVEPGEGAGHGGHEEGEGDDEEELADAVEGLERERLGLGEAGVHEEASLFRI
jgi:hypothetical protein